MLIRLSHLQSCDTSYILSFLVTIVVDLMQGEIDDDEYGVNDNLILVK